MARRIQPCIAVGMVEMPMRVDEMRNRLGAEFGKSPDDLGARYADTGIDEHLAIRAGQHSDVSPRAFKHADIISQLVRDDG